jgi:hypothetical protein
VSFTHVGGSPGGKRVHLTDHDGRSRCGRQTIDVMPIEEADLLSGDPWCGSCLNAFNAWAARLAAEITGLVLTEGENYDGEEE